MLLVSLTNTNINNEVEDLSLYQLCGRREVVSEKIVVLIFPAVAFLAFIYSIDTY